MIPPAVASHSFAMNKTEIRELIRSSSEMSRLASGMAEHLTMPRKYYAFGSGLVNLVYTDQKGNALVPLFSTAKTITWHETEFPEAVEKAIGRRPDRIDIAMFRIRTDRRELRFNGVISSEDFINYGNRSYHGNGVFFYNEDLPNEWCVRK